MRINYYNLLFLVSMVHIQIDINDNPYITSEFFTKRYQNMFCILSRAVPSIHFRFVRSGEYLANYQCICIIRQECKYIFTSKQECKYIFTTKQECYFIFSTIQECKYIFSAKKVFKHSMFQKEVYTLVLFYFSDSQGSQG